MNTALNNRTNPIRLYTQTVAPAKHAAQAAVMSLVFSPDDDGASLIAG
jgi:hypothetical protein